MNDILIILDNELNITEIDTLSDSTVVGLCFKQNDLYFSYIDKRIESLQKEVTQKIPLFNQLESSKNTCIKENTRKTVSYFYFTIKQTLSKLLELIEISQWKLQALKNFKKNEFRAAIKSTDVIHFISEVLG